MNKSVDNIFLSTNTVKARSRTHNARHSSAEKSEGIIAPMVPYKGRICTSPLRQDRPEREITLVRHPLLAVVTARTMGECKSSLRAPQRGAHAPQSHHPALAPLAPILTYRACRKCVPPRRQTGKRISESIKVADSIIRRAQPR